MSNYTQSTNFATKDALTSGDPLKIVKGTEINTEFVNISVAIATKADLASPTFTGTTTIPTVAISGGTITGITDITVADGGTGASTAANARTNLGLVIGTNVQAWDADLDTWATKTAPSGTVVGTSDTQTLTNKTLTSPNIGGTPVMNASVISSATAVASTSGTSVDFTGIPSWVKRITVMFQEVSASGTSNFLVRIGNTTFTVTGYVSTMTYVNIGANSSTGDTDTTGFRLTKDISAATSFSGVMSICLLSNYIYVAGFNGISNGGPTFQGGGLLNLGSVLDRIRITTVNGTDTFDAGSINILYE